MERLPDYQHRLQDLREQIDRLDESILQLLSRRADLVLKISALKVGQAVPLYAPWREEEILNRLKCLNPGPLYDQAVEEIFRAILKKSLELVHRAEGGRR